MPFLPISREEMLSLGFDTPDFVIVTGDAYVDHPSFGTAIISRVLESKGYNPLIASDLSYSDLIDYPYNFIKSTITLNKTYNSIKIIPSNKIDSIDININQILNTIVSSEIKIIIDIYREFNKKKEQFSKEEFIKNVKSKYNNNLSNEEIEKCIENKNFNFFLSVNKEKRYEFIVCSYNDFKLWINGLAFIIKNKKDILNAISENNIIK